MRTVDDFKSGPEFQKMEESEKYFIGENPTLSKFKAVLERDGKGNINLFAKIRVTSDIFNRLTTLKVNRLWFNPVVFDDNEIGRKLGTGFDKTAKDLATNAAVHGVAYGFWNLDHLQAFTALEYLPLIDERTGTHMAGIRFWRLSSDKPMYIQLYEIDGWTEWRRKDNILTLTEPKRPYKITVRKDALGEQVTDGENYPVFPVLPMYANTQHRSELTPPIKSKIDLYDAIKTTFGDTVLRTRAVYWILEGMSGNEKFLREALDAIEALGIIAPRGDDVKAKAATVDLPYKATMEYLDDLEDSIFSDAMVANPKKITGGSVTATAINAYFHAEKMKVSDMEYQNYDFISRLLVVAGLESEKIEFKHETISSDMEITQRLNMYSELDIETKLLKDPLFTQGEVDTILERIKNAQLGIGDDAEEYYAMMEWYRAQQQAAEPDGDE